MQADQRSQRNAVHAGVVWLLALALIGAAAAFAVARLAGADAQTGDAGVITVEKVGAEQGVFTVNIADATGADAGTVDIDLAIGATADSDELEGGTYTLTEAYVFGLTTTGWAFADAQDACPAEPSELTASLEVLVDGDIHVCVYNTEVGAGTLTVKKIGETGIQAFNVEVHRGEAMEAVGNVNVVAGGSADLELNAGDYTLSELEQAGYVHEGWALADEEGVCPATPDSTDDLFDVTIPEEGTEVVCVYNAVGATPTETPTGTATETPTTTATATETPTGTETPAPGTGILTVEKVGDTGDQAFNIEVLSGDESMGNLIVASGERDSINLDAGDYTISELEQEGFTFLGWAPAQEDDTCPAEPESTDVPHTVTVADGEETVICVYNAPGGNFAYDLYFRWNLIAWLGAEMPVEDALTSPVDISDQIIVIWHWDAMNQEWDGFFSGDDVPDIPGANDLTTLETLQSYWVALAEDTNTGDEPDAQWVIHSIVEIGDDSTPTETPTATATETPTSTATETPTATETATATDTDN